MKKQLTISVMCIMLFIICPITILSAIDQHLQHEDFCYDDFDKQLDAMVEQGYVFKPPKPLPRYQILLRTIGITCICGYMFCVKKVQNVSRTFFRFIRNLI